ncbi:hypothetical protein Amet_0836 [Alkaliphilus metalliredigens QYMF]|uniref:Uncharacterized protein n=1 Tax=Alkaliphilus metalliredigens (strain QYMF) TaxID=293826 RepID=A6TLJ3_ALKMQ|nr:hypothetical protein [Alkaliphilus metalliredigens]ABR47061.1 hypothetical protein Amet_0836 [Alkaliphilus metalliredigens QYMF]
MSLTQKEEVKRLVDSKELHINLKPGAELTEEAAEEVSKFIRFIQDKYKVERS